MSRKGQKMGSDSKSPMSANGKAAGPAPPANAWSQPLRPKTNAAQAPPPGMGGKSRSPTASAGGGGSGTGNSASNGVQNGLRERFVGLTLNLVGQKVVVTQTNGAVFEGIFHTFTPFNSLSPELKNKYVIKACRVVKPPTTTSNDSSEPQVTDQATVIISHDKVACLTVKSMRIDALAPQTQTASNSNGASSKQPKNAPDGFRTDTEISGGNSGRSREFEKVDSAWTTGGTGSGGTSNSRADALMGALDDKDKGPRRKQPFGQNANSAGLSGSIGQWDQFRANQELFNVNATFDENLYTTELDKTQIDKRKIQEAERLAREIENTTSSNLHIAEERGHIVEGDYDEEDRYSGVLKDSKAAIVSQQGGAKSNKASNNANTSEPQGKGKVDDGKPTSSSAAPKKMNYAAAAAKADAAKADTTKSGGPPGFAAKAKQTKTDSTTKEETPDKETATTTNSAGEQPPKQQPKPESEAKTAEPVKEPVEETKAKKAEVDKPAEKVKTAVEKAPEASGTKEAAAPDSKDDKAKPPATADAEKPAAKPKSKLNAGAKEFTLSIAAKPFVPGGAPAAVTPGPETHMVDPNAAMHGHVPGHMAPHYMHPGQMGQPGMMPMMNPQYPGMRYPGYGMEQQHMPPPMPPQPQHTNNSAQGSAAPSPGPGSVDGDGSQSQQQDGDAAQQQSSGPPPPQQQQPPQPGQPQQQPQQVPMPYGVPPQYYMPPRPGAPHPGFHPQHYVGGPQQIPVGPGGAPYRHMYPMQPGGMPPNVQVRPGAPYYGGPVPPVPYQHGHGGYVQHGMVDDDSGFRGGRGQGRGGRGNRSGGRGRRNNRGGRGYNSYHQQGGRDGGRGQHPGNNQNAQNMPSENWSAGDGAGGGGGGGGPPQSDNATPGGPPDANQGGKAGDNKTAAKQ